MPNFDVSFDSGFVRVELVEGGTSIADLVVKRVACIAIMFKDSSGQLTAHVASVRGHGGTPLGVGEQRLRVGRGNWQSHRHTPALWMLPTAFCDTQYGGAHYFRP